MLTSLILVSLTATTLLLLAVATEEALRLSRSSSRERAREDHARAFEAAVVTSLEEPARAGHSPVSSGLRQFPQRPRAQSRGGRPSGASHIPDQAA